MTSSPPTTDPAQDTVSPLHPLLGLCINLGFEFQLFHPHLDPADRRTVYQLPGVRGVWLSVYGDGTWVYDELEWLEHTEVAVTTELDLVPLFHGGKMEARLRKHKLEILESVLRHANHNC